jgi:hypothetical protein
MGTFLFSPRTLVATGLLLSAISRLVSAAEEAQVIFDLPETIECREVSPKKFAASHPSLKVIEAKLRISARITDGPETDIVDFLYMITSPGLHMKIQDYLPNTTLESTVQGDQIEIADTNESSTSSGEDAHINYKVLGLGGTMNQGSKKTESSHYKQIAAKALVVASGTTNREHGVFFKLRPSKGASLEGAKTFTFLAVGPNAWRGDWCILACAARAKKKSFFSTSVAVAGVGQAHIGMYLSGDREARFRAEELCEIQEANGAVRSTQLAKQGAGLVAAMHAATSPDHGSGHAWLHGIFGGDASAENGNQLPEQALDEPDLEQRRLEVQKAMLDVQERLNRLSGARF